MSIAQRLVFGFGGAAPASNAYEDEILADSPLAYYRLNEGSSAVTTDISGNGRNGGYSGTYTQGRPALVTGNTASLGLAGAGYATGGSGLNLSRDFTLECVFKPSAFVSGNALISHGRGGYYIRAGGSISFLKSQTSGIASGGTSLSTGTTYHLMLTMDGSGNYVCYLDGATEFSGSTATTFSGIGPFLIGVDYFSAPNAEFYSGDISDVAVYGSALSAGRVAAHYAAL